MNNDEMMEDICHSKSSN